MSTAGKVLIVLIVLAALGWITLAALVADHHMSWSRRYAELKSQSEELQASLPPLRTQIYETMNEATVVQIALDRARRNYRSALSQAQKTDSETKESLSRYTIQRETTEREVAAAQERHDVRRQERQNLDRQIAQEQAAIADLTAETAKLRDELATLRKTFQQTLAENKSYVEKLRKSKKGEPAASTGPRTRLGSLVR